MSATINCAADAVAIAEQHMTLESVLTDVEFAAKRGGRCWLFAWIPDDVQAELRARGFSLASNGGKHVSVEW